MEIKRFVEQASYSAQPLHPSLILLIQSCLQKLLASLRSGFRLLHQPGVANEADTEAKVVNAEAVVNPEAARIQVQPHQPTPFLLSQLRAKSRLLQKPQKYAGSAQSPSNTTQYLRATTGHVMSVLYA